MGRRHLDFSMPSAGLPGVKRHFNLQLARVWSAAFSARFIGEATGAYNARNPDKCVSEVN
jgi:hypothetical protein